MDRISPSPKPQRDTRRPLGRRDVDTAACVYRLAGTIVRESPDELARQAARFIEVLALDLMAALRLAERPDGRP